jgi:hypothetical protein
LNLPLFEPTRFPTRQEIGSFLGQAFAAVWVAGEVERVRESQRGHVYFELVEKGDGDQIVGKLDAVVWRGDWLRVRAALARGGQRLAGGQQIRCRGAVDFYPPGGGCRWCGRSTRLHPRPARPPPAETRPRSPRQGCRPQPRSLPAVPLASAW